MRRLLPLLALMVGLSGTPLLAQKSPAPKKLTSAKWKALSAKMSALFKATEINERMDIRTELADHPPLTKKDAEKLAKLCFKLAAPGFRIPKGAKFEFPLPDGRKGTVHVSGRGARNKGLWIGLHGGGRGIGDGSTAKNKWSSAVSANCVCLFPTVLPGMASGDPHAFPYIIGLIDAAKRTWGIDTNRVYCGGHSSGGMGTWQNSRHHPDYFAGVTPNAGGGAGVGLPENLYNLPIYFYHGTNDPKVRVDEDRAAAKKLAELKKAHPEGYDYVYKEYPNIGHGLPPGGLGKIIKWVTKHKRKAYPEKIVWHPYDVDPQMFYWLFSETPKQHGLVVAKWTGNALEVTCEKPGGLTILLTPELIDFGKPVTVKVNGKQEFSGSVTYSVMALATSIRERFDRKQYFMGHIVLKAPPEKDEDDD